MIPCNLCPDCSCCGLIIFEKEFIKNHEKEIEAGFETKEQGNFVAYLYKDNRCPFLDRKTKLCKIYDKRPQVCRDYGYFDKLVCPYFRADGTKRGLTERKIIQVKIDKQVDSIAFQLGINL
jgi:Fe-S-cluster containining protein